MPFDGTPFVLGVTHLPILCENGIIWEAIQHPESRDLRPIKVYPVNTVVEVHGGDKVIRQPWPTQADVDASKVFMAWVAEGLANGTILPPGRRERAPGGM